MIWAIMALSGAASAGFAVFYGFKGDVFSASVGTALAFVMLCIVIVERR